jgi:hypothetical protein
VDAEPSGVKHAARIVVMKERKIKVRRLAYWREEAILVCDVIVNVVRKY